MKRVFVVTEGQSETNFVNKVLTPYFAGRCILIPNTIVTKADSRHGKMYKGGVSNYGQIRSTLSKVLAIATKDKDTYVTTMLDYYQLPNDVPGVSDAEKINDPYDKVKHIEQEIQKAEKYEEKFFFPYIQLHEFEAMLFTDIAKLEEVYFDYDLTDLKECVKEQNNPELINNGVEKIAQSCRHFSDWITYMG